MQTIKTVKSRSSLQTLQYTLSFCIWAGLLQRKNLSPTSFILHSVIKTSGTHYNHRMASHYKQINKILLLGDWLVLFLVTLLGFFNHNQQFQLWRYLATALPLCLAWFFSAPVFGLFSSDHLSPSSSWWRIIWAVSLSTPLALLIRALLLASSVQVSFALVMILISTFSIIIWRLIWFKFIKR